MSYIEIPRWDSPDGFQHYKDRDPKWIKVYTRLLDDDNYLSLTVTQRAVLHGLWLMYAKSAGKVPENTSKLSRRLGIRVTKRTLDALNHAGFIEFSLAEPAQVVSLEKRREEKKEQKLSPQPQIGAPEARPERTRDLHWEVLLEVCGIDGASITATGRGAANKALRELKAAGATPDEIRLRASEFGRRYQLPLTPSALTKHWGSLRTGEQARSSRLANLFGAEAA